MGAEQPQSIANAVKLMYVGAGISLLGILFTVLQKNSIRDQVRDDYPSYSQDKVDSTVSSVIAFAIIGGLIGAGIWLWMANTNGKGKTWARTVATVLGGLNVLFALLGLGMGQSTPLSTVVSLISVVLAATILYLLYRPESNQYYRVMSGQTGY
jgi:hypothetical protein